MRPRLPPPLARLMHTLHPAHFSTQGRVASAILLVLIAVFALAGQQALDIARQDADAALHVQATAQLAALSQAVAGPAMRGDYAAVQTRLRIPIDQGNLRQVEYTAPDGRVLRRCDSAHPPPNWRRTRFASPCCWPCGQGLHQGKSLISQMITGFGWGSGRY